MVPGLADKLAMSSFSLQSKSEVGYFGRGRREVKDPTPEARRELGYRTPDATWQHTDCDIETSRHTPGHHGFLVLLFELGT